MRSTNFSFRSNEKMRTPVSVRPLSELACACRIAWPSTLCCRTQIPSVLCCKSPPRSVNSDAPLWLARPFRAEEIGDADQQRAVDEHENDRADKTAAEITPERTKRDHYKFPTPAAGARAAPSPHSSVVARRKALANR